MVGALVVGADGVALPSIASKDGSVKRLWLPTTIGIVLLVTIAEAWAAIRVYMDGWDYIPRVVVSIGRSANCDLNQVVFDGPITRKQVIGNYQQAGSQGLDVCWKRTADPLKSGSPLQSSWTRCSSDGDCIIS